MKRCIFCLEDRHIKILEDIKKETGCAMSETIRRLLDERAKSAEAVEKEEEKDDPS